MMIINDIWFHNTDHNNSTHSWVWYFNCYYPVAQGKWVILRKSGILYMTHFRNTILHDAFSQHYALAWQACSPSQVTMYRIMCGLPRSAVTVLTPQASRNIYRLHVIVCLSHMCRVKFYSGLPITENRFSFKSIAYLLQIQTCYLSCHRHKEWSGN